MDERDRAADDGERGGEDRDKTSKRQRWPLIALGIVVVVATIAGAILLVPDARPGEHRRRLYRTGAP